MLRNTRASAVKARTQAILHIKNLIITAPDELREALSGLTNRQLVKRCSAKPSISRLPNRYLMTARCGMLDMRHFFQLMHIALVRENAKPRRWAASTSSPPRTPRVWAPRTRRPTRSGRFGASYADAADSSPDAFASSLKKYLERCDPVDFTAMPSAGQDTIVDYYGSQTGGKPTNQNETATPAVIALPSLAGKDRSYPFYLDRGDPKTISDTESQKSDTEIRTWVSGTTNPTSSAYRAASGTGWPHGCSTLGSQTATSRPCSHSGVPRPTTATAPAWTQSSAHGSAH